MRNNMKISLVGVINIIRNWEMKIRKYWKERN